MKYITFNQIIELNNKLLERGLSYKIHLSDRCGGQSMWIEVLSDKKEYLEDSKNVLIDFIKDFFISDRINLEFSEDNMSFWIKQ